MVQTSRLLEDKFGDNKYFRPYQEFLTEILKLLDEGSQSFDFNSSEISLYPHGMIETPLNNSRTFFQQRLQNSTYFLSNNLTAVPSKAKLLEEKIRPKETLETFEEEVKSESLKFIKKHNDSFNEDEDLEKY